MAEVTLDQILAAPNDPDALQRHMQAIGVLSPVAAPNIGPTGPATPLTRPTAASSEMVPSSARVAPMTPPSRGAAPEMTGAPVTADAGPMSPKPMVLPKLNFKERQALPLGEPGTPAYDISLIERHNDQSAHPWGKRVFDSTGNEVPGEEQHPGVLGKIAHGLAKAGNIAGDIVAPSTMALIPRTELNQRGAYHENLRNLAADEARQTAEEAVRQRPEIAEATGAMKERLDEARDRANREIQSGHDVTRQNVAGTQAESRENVAGTQAGSREKVAAGQNVSRETIAGERNKTSQEIAHERAESAERIATGHNLAMTEAARIRASAANDPNKLTNTMKTMKQQAEATLPGIDRALDETEKVAQKLGPVQGRWNDFMTGKVGAGDPEFKHYKDEIGMVSSAVTLAHARGRMSNELFEHFEKMFDAGKLSPENMIQALNVAKEWLGDYAKMGETGSPVNSPAERPKESPRPANSGMKWQRNKKTGEFREVPS